MGVITTWGLSTRSEWMEQASRNFLISILTAADIRTARLSFARIPTRDSIFRPQPVLVMMLKLMFTRIHQQRNLPFWSNYLFKARPILLLQISSDTQYRDTMSTTIHPCVLALILRVGSIL